MRQFTFDTVDLFLFFFWFIFGHAVLITKDKDRSLTQVYIKLSLHSLYIYFIQAIFSSMIDYQKKKKKEKKSYILELSILSIIM